MSNRISPREFERLALPHLEAAYSLARWLTHNETDAEDVVQNAYLRAYKYSSSFSGQNFRAWLLAIVRNAAYDWLRDNRMPELVSDIDVDELTDIADPAPLADDPETVLLRKADHGIVNDLLAGLPSHLREVLILRELQELSYREIADIIAVPIGTVMSRLSRARVQLLADGQRRLKEASHD